MGPTELLSMRLEWLVIGGIVLLAFGGFEAGYRAGRRRTGLADAPRGQIFAVQAAMLALLGLLLAFSFSIASNHYDQRRAAIRDEANAIQTVYLRTRLLDGPRAERIRAHVREYVAVRLAPMAGRSDPGKVEPAILRSEEIHAGLWTEAAAAAREEPGSTSLPLLVSSVNELVDLHTARLVAMRSHIPNVVIVLLIAVTTIGMGAVGYGFGIVNQRDWSSALALVLLVTGTVAAVLDIDRGARGFTSVSQQAMVDVQRAIAIEPSPSGI